MKYVTADTVIIGAGIVGLACARELQQRDPSQKIIILEKEAYVARHQSGRNSGVIHAGIYYPPGSLKAHFCREGLASTTRFCDEHQIPYEQCGKLIVATDELEMERLPNLFERASVNNIPIETLDEAQIRELEPNIKGIGGLYSPKTGIVDYSKIAQKMAELFLSRNGQIHFDQQVIRATETHDTVEIKTPQTHYSCARVIACAGLQADRLITRFGEHPDFRIIPFRGDYYRILNQPSNLVNHLIYPVPDPAQPFLGVHLTRKMDGGFTVGPNAVLAPHREGYKRWQLSPRDLANTLSYLGFWKLIKTHRQSALNELRASFSKRHYLNKVHKYCDLIKLDDLQPYPSGIRAQAVDHQGKMLDDFHFYQTRRCLHVANAPSPAATSCIPIAQYIIDRISDTKTQQIT